MKVLLIMFAALHCFIEANSQRVNRTGIKITVQSEVGSQIEKAIIEYGDPKIPIVIRKMVKDTFDISSGKRSKLLKTTEDIFLIVHWANSKERYFLNAEPGDDLRILLQNNGLKVSGIGSEKYELQRKIDSVRNSIPKPVINPSGYSMKSLEDWFEWHHYLDEQIRVITPLIESYKTKLSAFAFNIIKARFFDDNIDERTDKFSTIFSYAKKNGLTGKDLNNIYDSTYGASVPKLFQFVSKYHYGSNGPVVYNFYRKYNFEFASEPLNSGEKRQILIYEDGIKAYKSLPREQFIIDMMRDNLVGEYGFTKQIEGLVSSYLSEPGYKANKDYLTNFILDLKERTAGKKKIAFQLTDSNGSVFTEQQIKGKIAILDFWFTGCVGCIQMAPAMRKVEEHFRNDTNVVFLSISVDQNKARWLKSVKEKKYTTGNGVNLYTGGTGNEHPIINDWAISGYPSIITINSFGQMTRLRSALDPRRDDGKRTIRFIEDQLNYMHDGPYVINENGGQVAYYFNGSGPVKKKIDNRNLVELSAQTDDNKRFDFRLGDYPDKQSSVYGRPEKLLVLSDIEGNFNSFRRILQGNGIIDENYNWIFGKGHLIFGGDMFDRGTQVTECLWLIYSLEEKAKRAGGYVHFILGNHEIMNLYGNEKYVQEKYKGNAVLIGKSIKELYNENSELGRWLRTKNIIERMGDLLFAHGGMAKEFSDSVTLSIEEINVIARKHLGEKINDHTHPDRNVRWVYSHSYSPFWFRMYYSNDDKKLQLVNDPSVKWTIKHPDMQEMDSILERWNVRRIITGHTIIADTISVHYGGKVINTDTDHAEGKSEALLIEGDKFYRVNDKGQRWLLLDESKKKKVVLKAGER